MAKIDTKSVIFGAALAITGVGRLGGAEKDPAPRQFMPQRFLVLEATPKGDPANGLQSLLLKLCPTYGKITADGLKFRMENETQELTMLFGIDAGYEIRRGDIISFETFRHMKLSPGTKLFRRLPSGGHEAVP